MKEFIKTLDTILNESESATESQLILINKVIKTLLENEATKMEISVSDLINFAIQDEDPALAGELSLIA